MEGLFCMDNKNGLRKVWIRGLMIGLGMHEIATKQVENFVGAAEVHTVGALLLEKVLHTAFSRMGSPANLAPELIGVLGLALQAILCGR